MEKSTATGFIYGFCCGSIDIKHFILANFLEYPLLINPEPAPPPLEND